MLHPRPNLTSFDPTSLCLVKSLYFQLNAKSQTQPHFVQLGLCISNSMLSPRLTKQSEVRSSIFYSMLHPRPNLTSFG
ncbi:hypothetical protein E4T56_gene6303 [Termitomyces sp. T112]|nr:hypothetical protein E4T56_gene6303 [Termitomyces sp. T112]